MKKIVALLICVVMLVTPLASCGKPPEFSEIEGRLRELIEASYAINEMLFGEGLPTYARITDPRSNTKIIRENNDTRMTYYYEIYDEGLGRIIAYRVVNYAYSFAQVLDAPDAERTPIWQDTEKGLYAYEIEYTHEKTADNKLADPIKNTTENTITNYYELQDEVYGRIIAYRISDLNYTYVQVLEKKDPSRIAVYENASEKAYAYVVPYTYVEPELYYTDQDPTDYDYVRKDAPYQTIEEMKTAAELVYSKDYLSSLYLTLFEGTELNDDTMTSLSARYFEQTDEYGAISLMKSNTYEPLVTEKRIFDLSTAVIVRPKHKKFVTVSVESYLESTPQNRETIKLSLIFQDGVWMLDSGTY